VLFEVVMRLFWR